jgi:uncharacterized protein YutE (UPF0331/DUF86 family)
MEHDRTIRYKEKISYIFECLREIDEVMPEPSGIVLKGVFYDLSSAIEAMMDMIAMLCKDLGIMPRGDYENIQSLHKRNTISESLASRLAKCNGLRNVLVHQYNGIDEARVISSVRRVEEDMREFIRVVEGFLGEA